jgi:hypothetical protein
MLLCRHWLITVLAAAGLLLRFTSDLAYRPALIYVDSLRYLYGASPGADPLGHKAVLLAVRNLEVVVLLQHLLGIAVAVLIYVTVLRRGASRWLAALAAAPVLLDAYQMHMEQTIMPDAWFDAMIVAGLAVLLWRPTLIMPFAAAGGLILGTSATVRDAGELLIVPALVYVIVAVRGWRRVIELGGALCLAFALPVLCFCGVSYINAGHFWLPRAFAGFPFRQLGRAQVDRPVAAFLRAYQLGCGCTLGPLLALFALAGVTGSVLALLRRPGSPHSRQFALACLLFTVTGVAMLLVPDVLEFSWRYQLPALVTLPPAGVLGLGAILSARRARAESRGERVIAASDVAWVPGAPENPQIPPEHGARLKDRLSGSATSLDSLRT